MKDHETCFSFTSLGGRRWQLSQLETASARNSLPDAGDLATSHLSFIHSVPGDQQLQQVLGPHNGIRMLQID